MDGGSYLSPGVSKHVIASYLDSVDGASRQEDIVPVERLTSRQREILQLIAEGKTSKEIANMLNISHKTVNAHRLRIMTQLGVNDIPSLVRYAIRIGLISE
jgi:DNA-binding NarL/FixJ family response regulator